MAVNPFGRSPTKQYVKDRWRTAVHIAGYSVGTHLIGEYTYSLQISGRDQNLTLGEIGPFHCSGMADFSGGVFPFGFQPANGTWDAWNLELARYLWPNAVRWVFVSGCGPASEALIDGVMPEGWSPNRYLDFPKQGDWSMNRAERILEDFFKHKDDRSDFIETMWTVAGKKMAEDKTRQVVLDLANELMTRGCIGLEEDTFDLEKFFEEQLPEVKGWAPDRHLTFMDTLPPLVVPHQVQLCLHSIGLQGGFKELAA